MIMSLNELSCFEILANEKRRLLDDAEDLRWCARWLADRDKSSDNDIALLLEGSEIAERRAAAIHIE